MLKDRVHELGQKLKVDCPDNDCVVFLNTFVMLEGVTADLNGCLLSEWGRKVLGFEQEKLERELEMMYLTNYAVRKYRLGK